MSKHKCDVVIVGGGIGGASLASALAGDGLRVVVLEATHEYEDRVRGESMLPWGVKEAQELGVAETLLAAGAHVAPEWVHYDADVPAEIAEANPIPVALMAPGVPGSLNLRHPDACGALIAAAQAVGADVHRGVRDVMVRPGPTPTICARANEIELELGARLIVGADGRSSTIRRQCGIGLRRQVETNMIAGLLVDGLDGVPDERDFLASTDDLFMASFHQGGGRLRVYLCPGVAQRHRFGGPGGLDEFLRSAPFECLPFHEQLAHARPAGPLATYPGDDSWIGAPYTDGVVLVGDAAGFNNPIIGQGLSITMRDVRMVRDVVREGDLSPDAFSGYGSERVERMRRLRAASTFMAAAFAEDCDNRPARRARFFELQEHEPLALGLLAGMMAGPETAPPEACDGHLVAAIRAA